MLVLPLLFVAGVSANFFDFFQQQFHGEAPQDTSPEEFEANLLNDGCGKYFCPDTRTCVETPNDCPCPYPSSQLRCVLPNGEYLCISKPAGDISQLYLDPETNWKLDAGGDVRDCG